MMPAPNADRARIRAGVLAATVLALLVARTAAAQEQDQERRLAARLAPDVAAAVGRLADSVKAAGLPSEPLLAIALEGATRHATGERILRAVREYARALGAARQALGMVAARDEVVSAAGVIVAGVAPHVVRDYRDARPSASLTVPFVVLADLIARGVPVDSAANALGDALRRGAGDDDLSELRRRVEADITAGAGPGTAMSIRSRDLPRVGQRLAPRPSTPRLRRPPPH